MGTQGQEEKNDRNRREYSLQDEEYEDDDDDEHFESGIEEEQEDRESEFSNGKKPLKPENSSKDEEESILEVDPETIQNTKFVNIIDDQNMAKRNNAAIRYETGDLKTSNIQI